MPQFVFQELCGCLEFASRESSNITLHVFVRGGGYTFQRHSSLLHSGQSLHLSPCIYPHFIALFIYNEDDVRFKCGGGLHTCVGVEYFVNDDL